MTSKSITISYKLQPPSSLTPYPEHLDASKTHTFPVITSSESDKTQKSTYYASLKTAILEAKDEIGKEMTEWRDAVGKGELSKENKKTLQYDADDPEAEDEEE
ncbi:hypothetical protein DL96DRAFT_1576587 [Flagelloscypha sp. PMI_526]|nr:hypothetical protein DL96DRAFT_1576587 [Flagelloscypha sp. PMI_526]